ncbi:MAG: MBG domain-containing protein, partial [Clostridia bacterium]|nr:MBG domain-containing protein [Clostridia bacterium]
ITVSGAQTNAGTYNATATINSSNYTISNSTCTFTISAKTITITWNTEGTVPTATLSDSNAAFTYQYYTSSGTYLGTTAPTTEGSYTVKVVLTDTKNYTLSGTTEQSFTITED